MTEKRSGGFRDRRHHNKSSYHPYRENGGKRRFSSTSSTSGSSVTSNRIVSVQEALKTDRILSIESFSNVERIRNQEEASTAYAKYVKDHQKAHLRNIYNLHKKEKWILNLINSSENAVSLDKSVYESISWDPEINLEYKEDYEMKLEEASNEGNNFISGTETRIYSNEKSEEKVLPFSSLLPEFSNQIIAMSNVPPHADKEALESHLKEFVPEGEIEITCPNPDKNYYRLAWLKVRKNVSNEKIEELVSKLESLGSIEGSKVYFGIVSSNFRRFKVTNYLEGSEGELLNLALQIIKLFDKSFDSGLLSLDKAVIYLRNVHNFCFYCGTKFSCSHEVSVKCGDLHLRRPSVNEQVKHDQHRLIEKLSALIDFMKALNEVSIEDGCTLDETLSESSIIKVEEGKYRCHHCSKAFKGPEFVLKHLMLKHEDVVSQTQVELEDFKKLLKNAQLWLFPITMIPRYTKIRNKNYYGSSRDSQTSSKSSFSKNNSRRDYMDWDAAANNNNNSSTEINYDL